MSPARKGGRAGAKDGAVATAVPPPGSVPPAGAATGDGTPARGGAGAFATGAAAGRGAAPRPVPGCTLRDPAAVRDGGKARDGGIGIGGRNALSGEAAPAGAWVAGSLLLAGAAWPCTPCTRPPSPAGGAPIADAPPFLEGVRFLLREDFADIGVTFGSSGQEKTEGTTRAHAT